MPDESSILKVAVSVSDMARMLGLSRSRFHQLLKEGVFPAPSRCQSSPRPFYDGLTQEVCLDVRRRNVGINGKTIMFYSRPFGPHLLTFRPRPLGAQGPSARKKEKPTPVPVAPAPKNASLIEGLKQLGLSDLTESKVSAAVIEVFPQGLDSQPHEAVLTAIFRHLSRQNSGDSHTR